MAESRRLRLGEVRAIFRLIGECRDLAGDPEGWTRHSFEGLCQILGASSAVGGEHRRPDPEGPFEFVRPVETGLSPAQMALFGAFLEAGGPNHPSILPSIRRLAASPLTRARKQLIDEPAFQASGVGDLFKRAEIGDIVMSIVPFGPPGSVHVCSLLRPYGDREFSPRERRLIHLFQGELGPLIGPVLATAPPPDPLDGLSPRLRQTLACLLEGDSEKQVAARLGLSRPTVHQYVTALYRHFGVASRAGLLAHFLRRRRSGG